MRPSSLTIIVKTALAPTVTYFLMGLAALALLDYADKYADPAISILMRQTTDPLVAAGPLLQVIRGALFGTVIFLLRDVVPGRNNGLPEILLQSLMLSVVATRRINHPERKWLGWLMGIVIVIIILLSTAGVLAGLGFLPTLALEELPRSVIQ